MSKITITEALAEIKTIEARISKKQQFIVDHLVRQERMKDPLEKHGGSPEVIARERQAVGDLAERKLALRRAIQQANEANKITLGPSTRTIADWLVWRREVAPGLQSLLATLSRVVQQARAEAAKKGLAVVTTADVARTDNDLIINLDEHTLAADIEQVETAIGSLDGQLSLKNATVTIEV